MEKIVVPAIIAKSQQELNDNFKKIPTLARRVQLDVMDGQFVPNTSLNFPFQIPPNTREYEAHLMMNNPLEWVEAYANKVDIILLHLETLNDIESAITAVKTKGVKIGLALVPDTPSDAVIPYLDQLDELLMMTVVPGSYCKGIKEFSPIALEKIREIRKINPTIPIEVDGCMDQETIKLARDAGANIFASGSYIIKSDNPDLALKKLESLVL